VARGGYPAVLAQDARVNNPRHTNFEAGGTTALPTEGRNILRPYHTFHAASPESHN
jgi:hypothetical protein